MVFAFLTIQATSNNSDLQTICNRYWCFISSLDPCFVLHGNFIYGDSITGTLPFDLVLDHSLLFFNLTLPITSQGTLSLFPRRVKLSLMYVFNSFLSPSSFCPILSLLFKGLV